MSSPGAERPIRRPEEWAAAIGRRVNVRLREGESELVLEGRLVSDTGDAAEIEIRDRRTTRADRRSRSDAVVAARIVVDI